MKPKYLPGLLMTLLVVGMGFAGCGKSYDEQMKERQARSAQQRIREQKAFKIAVTPTMDCLPLFLLADSVLYDTTKIDIVLKPFAAHMDIDTALVGGSVQVAVTELVRAEQLKARHVPLRYVAATNLSWQLIGNKNNKIKDIKSLADCMISMTRYSVTDWMTNEILRKHKPKAKVFSVQINDVNTRFKMLNSNDIDAAWLPEPQATAAVVAGNVSLHSSEKDAITMGVLAYREPQNATTALREQELRAFLAAYDRAAGLISQKGVVYYSSLIKKHINVDDKTIARLPKLRYERAEAPLQKNIKRASTVRFEKRTPRMKSL